MESKVCSSSNLSLPHCQLCVASSLLPRKAKANRLVIMQNVTKIVSCHTSICCQSSLLQTECSKVNTPNAVKCLTCLARWHVTSGCTSVGSRITAFSVASAGHHPWQRLPAQRENTMRTSSPTTVRTTGCFFQLSAHNIEDCHD